MIIKSHPRPHPLRRNGDFGSILGFIEKAFGWSYIGPSPNNGYAYADYYAPDGPVTCGSNCPFPLSDFFTPTQHSFKPITGVKYIENCFRYPNTSTCFGTSSVPLDADNDGVDEQ